METTNTGIIRFDLKDSVEKNWDLYQDALEASPELFKQLKWRFDQYLKTVPLHIKEESVEESSVIAFDVVN